MDVYPLIVFSFIFSSPFIYSFPVKQIILTSEHTYSSFILIRLEFSVLTFLQTQMHMEAKEIKLGILQMH